MLLRAPRVVRLKFCAYLPSVEPRLHDGRNAIGPRLAIGTTSVRSIDATWTTTHLAHAALAAGHMLRIIEAHDFEITSTGRMVARAWCLDRPIVHVDETGRTISQRAMERRYVELTACDMILLRVNPLPWHILQLATMASAVWLPRVSPAPRVSPGQPMMM